MARPASRLESKDQLTETSSRSRGRAGVWTRPGLTFFVCEEAPKAENLSHEDADGDEDLRDHPEGPPQVLGGQLPQVHGDNIGRQAWQGIEVKTPSGNMSLAGTNCVFKHTHFYPAIASAGLKLLSQNGEHLF